MFLTCLQVKFPLGHNKSNWTELMLKAKLLLFWVTNIHHIFRLIQESEHNSETDKKMGICVNVLPWALCENMFSCDLSFN